MTLDLPPEAFTKKTLQEACSWLEDQPEELRNMIHTKERLVGLYQKSKRLKEWSDFTSSEKFIHDLKNLIQSENSDNDKLSRKSINLEKDSKKLVKEDSENQVELDTLSRKRVDEVKKRFNLTSNSEALRLLISLGFEKFMQFQ